MKNAKTYPLVCQSAFCGKIDCTGCRNLPELKEFKAWRERSNAYQPDPIHNKSYWVASNKGV